MENPQPKGKGRFSQRLLSFLILSAILGGSAALRETAVSCGALGVPW